MPHLTHHVRADQDREALARATYIAYLDHAPIELVPVAGLPELTEPAARYIEEFMATIGASVSWAARADCLVATLTPLPAEAAA